MNFSFLFLCFCIVVILGSSAQQSSIVLDEITVKGPGLFPQKIVMPARYFFVHFRGENYNGTETVHSEDVKVTITGKTKLDRPCEISTNVLNRKDSSFIVRYKLSGAACYNFIINLVYKGAVLPGFPLLFKGPVYPDDCVCPEDDIDVWLHDYGCDPNDKQIKADLSRFQKVDFDSFYQLAVDRFNNSYSESVCHYVIKSNQVYRNCYGQHVGFKMFMDAILLSLARKVVLPDFEFFSNLGDWPLMKLSRSNLFPMFSWCGSKDTADIVMPTYEVTQASLECMGRVMLDMLSVQGNIDKNWEQKEDKLFWRGRDSREERLKLISIAKKHPDLFNASLTNFFFYRDRIEEYGPKMPHISFFKFFDYKYQLCIDGTVAAYRFPFLLAGDSVVLKPQSDYYEHFYNRLTPWVHYIPVKSDLSDLVDAIKLAKEDDELARSISRNGRKFALNNLLPQHIICYHATLFYEWSKLLTKPAKVRHGMELLKHDERGKRCSCERTDKDEL